MSGCNVKDEMGFLYQYRTRFSFPIMGVYDSMAMPRTSLLPPNRPLPTSHPTRYSHEDQAAHSASSPIELTRTPRNLGSTTRVAIPIGEQGLRKQCVLRRWCLHPEVTVAHNRHLQFFPLAHISFLHACYNRVHGDAKPNLPSPARVVLDRGSHDPQPNADMYDRTRGNSSFTPGWYPISCILGGVPDMSVFERPV